MVGRFCALTKFSERVFQMRMTLRMLNAAHRAGILYQLKIVYAGCRGGGEGRDSERFLKRMSEISQQLYSNLRLWTSPNALKSFEAGHFDASGIIALNGPMKAFRKARGVQCFLNTLNCLRSQRMSEEGNGSILEYCTLVRSDQRAVFENWSNLLVSYLKWPMFWALFQTSRNNAWR